MLRSIAAIVAAIQLSQPRVSDADAQRFATAIHQQASVHDFDPFTGVALIFHESSFNPNVVSRDGEDYGLAQIRARFIGGCKYSPSPVRNPTPDCLKEKERLLKPEENIRTMAELITRHRDLCERKVGSTAFAQWLASYQGRNNARQKRWCTPGPGTWKIVDYRQYLIRQLYKMGILKRLA
jgi:Transglycosylase SLT domain